MKKSSPAAARRYARALFDVALAKEQAPAVRVSLRTAAGILLEHKDLMDTLKRPTVSADKKKAILRGVVRSADDLTLRFLDILVDKGRVIDVPHVAKAFESLWNAHRNVAPADVVSALELEAAEEDALRAALEKLTGSAVEIKKSVDPRLVGGVVVSVGALTYDGSVRSQLLSLRKQLSGQA